MTTDSLRDLIIESSTPEPNTGCWFWDKSIASHGYALVRLGGRRRRAHRASFEAFRGAIPHGQHVCHRCDVPSCVNPDHLFIGTHLDNMRDKVAKGRQARGSRVHSKRRPRGEDNHSAKLTANAVREIRGRAARGESYNALGREFRVDATTLRNAALGLSWRHL